MSTLRISQLAERTGFPASTLRFYEGAGLLSPGRTAAGYRVYGEESVERLGFIRAAKNLGLPLEEIAEVLGVRASGACAEVRTELRPRIAARLVGSRERVAELGLLIADLERTLDHLDALPDSGEPCTSDCCPGHPSPVEAEAEGGEGDVGDGEAASCGCGGEAGGADQGERWREAPVACALTGAVREERVERWREAVRGAVRLPLAEGLRLTLPAARTAELAALAAEEQRCCPFFDFRLHLDGPELHVEVRAPQEGTEVLEELFGPGT
ncbi:MerR family transcriptional regulator [Streptomyces physcomitrii]|uniref:MerR family transcriptional regulator n=1 Tax=Streptomyces physcomitrii TaxID=2724184 RepID=UPI0033F58705